MCINKTSYVFLDLFSSVIPLVTVIAQLTHMQISKQICNLHCFVVSDKHVQLVLTSVTGGLCRWR